MTPTEHREPVTKALRDAAALVERAWAQGAWARNYVGDAVWDIYSRAAVNWCAASAIQIVHDSLVDDEYACDALSAHIGDDDITAWNDAADRTAAQVAAAMRACADRVERGEL